MATLNEISGLSEKSQQLLNAAEIETAEDLAVFLSVDLHRNLQLVNARYSFFKRIPSIKVLGMWIEQAQNLTGVEPGEGDTLEASVVGDDEGGNVAVAQVIDSEPASVPLSPRKSSSIGTDSMIDEGFVTPTIDESPSPKRKSNGFKTFKEYESGEDDDSVENESEEEEVVQGEAISPDEEKSPETDVSDVAGAEEPERLIEKIHTVDHEAASRRVDKRRRGIVYPAPGLLLFGSIISILTRFFFWMTLACLVFILFFQEYLLYVAAIPILFVFFGLFYLGLVGRVKCRTCSCPLMYSRNCLKNKKAHKIGFLSHLMSMSIYIVVLKWFRCMYCGTAIRLKE